MTANVLEHRRAKAFAEALEAHQREAVPNTGTPEASSPTGAFAELLSVADDLGGLPGPSLTGEARSVQRAQLMAAFEQEWAGGQTARVPQQRRHRGIRAARRGRWGRRLAIGGLVAGVAVGGFTGAAFASSNALPGDALYGMKRGLEGLRLDLAGSDSERGALLLDQASTRLEEAQNLLGRAGREDGLSPAAVDQVRRALDDMHAEAVRGRELLRSVYRSNGSLAPMRKLATFADGEDGRWAAIQGQLPPQLTTEAGRVDRFFGDVNEDVAPLHLEQPPAKPATGVAPAAPASGSSAPEDAPEPSKAASGGSAANGGPASRQPQPQSGVGGLVHSLTDPLTGTTGNGTAPTGNATPGTAPKSAPTPAPSAAQTTPEGTPQGLTIPPLLPGLLPGLGL
ncbi:hypothetical protein CFP65_3153 [Kitasatospora sp. MMS16-BH015]|uniref:DUF5667 domain-containing protein n=1 Tax=Kitasatospora sp. MMS16-BH015 TaxID=2018025 RepID=UPI000CA3BCC3|nr:DUF5667 domain-containing protein [Kitasatospora sp. MMS16-BH015]AUG77959.1 hypothetical protein CFP65_3153 [Kitasatospora sp. MMS16-BH015]